jgi:hypothetical protein
MLFILSIAVVFLALIVYLYFRAEKLQQQLNKTQTESRHTRKEMKSLLESLMLMITKQDEFVKQRLQMLKDLDEKNSSLKMITPLINNYVLIASECLKGKGQLSIIMKKCYEKSEAGSYKAFTLWLKTQDVKIKRMWNSNTLSGYLSLVEALLSQQTQILLANTVERTKNLNTRDDIAKVS